MRPLIILALCLCPLVSLAQSSNEVLLYLNVEEIGSFEQLIKLEEEAGGNSSSSMPVVYFRNQILSGQDIIPQLSRLLRASISISAPGQPAQITGQHADNARRRVNALHSPSRATSTAQYLAYFFLPGCRDCSRADILLKHMGSAFPRLEVDRYNIMEPGGRLMLEIVLRHFHLEGEAKSLVPLIVWNDSWLSGGKIIPSQLVSALGKSSVPDVPFWRKVTQEELDVIGEELQGGFRMVSLVTILTAGLIDGINPCAFATAIFLVSYLAVAGRNRRQIGITGAGFCSGVFISYFMMGLGLLQVLTYIQRFAWVARSLYGAMAIAGLVLFAGTVRDLAILKRQGAYKMKMGLSRTMKQRIHRVIHSRVATTGIVLAGILMGFVVSLLELACTGQIYFPTLILINSLQSSNRSVLALAGYNVAFILPLLLVTLMGILGVSSVSVSRVAERHVVWTKSFMAVLFLGMAVIMVLLLLRRM